MTATSTPLLTADEAERLTLGINVIIRPGDMPDDLGARTRQRMYEEQILVGMFDNVHQITDPPGRVAPPEWVALTGPCPNPDCEHGVVRRLAFTPPGRIDMPARCTHPDCRDGRRIVPLYTECPACKGTGQLNRDHLGWTPGLCGNCEPPTEPYAWASGRVLVGRGNIEVVPVVTQFHGSPDRCMRSLGLDWFNAPHVMLKLGPEREDGSHLTVHRVDREVTVSDFGIVIDVTELA